MLSVINEILSYPFLCRALVVGLLVSLPAAVLGVNLVLKKYSLIGDGLSHVGFGAVTIATACGATLPLAIALPVVAIAAIILLKLHERDFLPADSAIALVSSGALAIRVAITSLTTGLNVDICNFMFGSILALSPADAWLAGTIALLALIMILITYRQLFAITFDEDFAAASGLKTNFFTNLLAVLTALLIVVGMRMLGVMLISSIIVLPALAAMQLAHSFRGAMLTSGIIAVVAFVVGLYVSYLHDISTGASVVIVNLVIFCANWLIKQIRQ